ncbi:MAG: aldose 1-epimerase family protein [Succinivibrionaceae bacterium]|nr:aldose 1-epimerase family protein [Succinivibrionaceae bacterium]
MTINPYLGCDAQIRGVERHRLLGGRGDGLELWEIRNGRGLRMQLCPSRNNDIPRLEVDGTNIGYLSPSGYAHPAYFERGGDLFLRNFTAGYLTSCGLENVGTPNRDCGEDLGLHGSIGNLPCASASFEEREDCIEVRSMTRDEAIFKRKWELRRTIRVSTGRNAFTLSDTITNTNDRPQPLEYLYHQNFGYPLLDEDAQLTINSVGVDGRTDLARRDLARWNVLEPPQAQYEERCYYHHFGEGEARVELYQPKLGLGVRCTFDPRVMPCFTEWKNMGVREYVLGLEPGNCTPDGRDAVRAAGNLVELAPGESRTYGISVEFFRKG